MSVEVVKKLHEKGCDFEMEVRQGHDKCPFWVGQLVKNNPRLSPLEWYQLGMDFSVLMKGRAEGGCQENFNERLSELDPDIRNSLQGEIRALYDQGVLCQQVASLTATTPSMDKLRL